MSRWKQLFNYNLSKDPLSDALSDLSDSKPSIRKNACQKILDIGHKAVPSLIDTALSSESGTDWKRKKKEAVNLLGHFGNQDSNSLEIITCLLQCYEDPEIENSIIDDALVFMGPQTGLHIFQVMLELESKIYKESIEILKKRRFVLRELSDRNQKDDKVQKAKETFEKKPKKTYETRPDNSIVKNDLRTTMLGGFNYSDEQINERMKKLDHEFKQIAKLKAENDSKLYLAQPFPSENEISLHLFLEAAFYLSKPGQFIDFDKFKNLPKKYANLVSVSNALSDKKNRIQFSFNAINREMAFIGQLQHVLERMMTESSDGIEPIFDLIHHHIKTDNPEHEIILRIQFLLFIFNEKAGSAFRKGGRSGSKILISLFQEDDPNTKHRCIELLDQLKLDSPKIINCYKAALSSEDRNVQKAAIRALGNISATDILYGQLLRADEDLVSDIFSALMESVPSMDSVPHIKLLLINRPVFMDDSVSLLAAVGPGVIPEMHTWLDFQTPVLRETALQVIGRTAENIDDILPVLLNFFSDDNPEVRCSAIKSVKNISDRKLDATAALDALVNSLDDPALNVQSCALKAMESMGSYAKKALPRLTEIFLKNPHENRDTFIDLFYRLGSGCPVPSLLESIYHVPNSAGRHQIKNTVEKFLPYTPMTKEVVEAWDNAPTFKHIYSGERHDAGTISQHEANKAVAFMCRINSVITSNLLHLVLRISDVSVQMDKGCADNIPRNTWMQTVSFEYLRKRAKEELERRGSPSYDPSQFYNVSSNLKEEIEAQILETANERAKMLVSRLEGSYGEHAVRLAEDLTKNHPTAETFSVIRVKLAETHLTDTTNSDVLYNCLVSIAEQLGDNLSDELSHLKEIWPGLAKKILKDLKKLKKKQQ